MRRSRPQGPAVKLSVTHVRIFVGFGFATLLVLLLGPFQGLEARLGLSDKTAHAAAFYVLSLGLFASFPRIRRTDLAFGVVGFAAATEIAQLFTGRSGSFEDFAADSAGIVIAVLPAMVERLRYSLHRAPEA
jgi:VanZ family protein